MKYLVALSTGGFAEDDGKYFYQDFKVIEADTEEKAEEIYNEQREYKMFNGECLGLIEDFNPILIGHPAIEQSTLCLYKINL